MSESPTQPVPVTKFNSGQLIQNQDLVVVEEPLEIRIVFGPDGHRKTRSLSVTMRTPGNDFELATGFLVSEGIISRTTDIAKIRNAGPENDSQTRTNTVEIELASNVQFEMSKLQRHFYTTSSCGVCGKTSLDAIRADSVKPVQTNCRLAPSVITGLPAQLRDRQTTFHQTGGLHAAGLVTPDLNWLAVREDVGRHNAVDKLIGSQFIAGRFPLPDTILVLSGRASFELLQKALLASIPFVVAVGAPSSLAIDLAQEFGITLVGFTSDDRFNIYAHASPVA